MVSTGERLTTAKKQPTRGFSATVAMAIGAVFVLLGLYAFVAPRSFFDVGAVFEPYNAHFIHDIGAFQIGLGAVLLCAALMADGLAAALWGVAIGNTFHLLAHALDSELGGNPALDLPFFAGVTALLVVAALARRKHPT